MDWLHVSMTAVPPTASASKHTEGNEKARFLSWYHGLTGGDWGTDPDDLDMEYLSQFVEKVSKVFGKDRYFGLDAKGFENVPTRPSLLVSNHSGGAAAPDAWGLLMSWYNHFKRSRPLHGLAHEMVLSIKATGEPFSKCGILRADMDMATRVFNEYKRDIVVMPGGDVEVFRPHKDRYKVDFAGRRGYARLALKAGVPIVPVANAGAHDTLVVLTDGRPIAKALKLKQIFRLNVWPIHLSFPWGLALGPVPHLPPPTLLRYRVGPPVEPPPHSLAPGQEPSDALVREYDKRVQDAIQSLLDGLEAESVPPHRYMLDTCKRLLRKVRRRK